MQILDRKAQILGEGAIAADDAQNRALLTVGRTAVATGRALSARSVDLSDHALTEPIRRTSDHFADELVTENPLVWIVASDQLEVRVADARAQDLDQGFSGWELRDFEIFPNRNPTVLEPNATHRVESMTLDHCGAGLPCR